MHNILFFFCVCAGCGYEKVCFLGWGGFLAFTNGITKYLSIKLNLTSTFAAMHLICYIISFNKTNPTNPRYLKISRKKVSSSIQNFNTYVHHPNV